MAASIRGTIYADGEAVWANLDSGNDQIDHLDEEWRFSDVELSAQAADGSVQLRFELASNGSGTFGGWTMDDLCVVGWIPTVCGDGLVTGLEECDAGSANSDTDPDACRSTCVPASCGDGVIDSGEECDDGNLDEGDECGRGLRRHHRRHRRSRESRRRQGLPPHGKLQLSHRGDPRASWLLGPSSRSAWASSGGVGALNQTKLAGVKRPT